MNNLNCYTEAGCREICQKFQFYKRLSEDFDHLSWTKNFVVSNVQLSSTIREEVGNKVRILKETWFSMVPFYYLNCLLEKQPEKIYDLGAGWNVFKRYIPNIIAVSPTTHLDNFSDINDYVDIKFIKKHQNAFESVYSINALHFEPLENLEEIITNFVSMVKPSGRGFLALNLQRMVERTKQPFSKEIQECFDNAESIPDGYDQYVRKVLNKIKGINFLVVDIDFSKSLSDPMDGNIRIVFEKQ
jgi:hypothetical protein